MIKINYVYFFILLYGTSTIIQSMEERKEQKQEVSSEVAPSDETKLSKSKKKRLQKKRAQERKTQKEVLNPTDLENVVNNGKLQEILKTPYISTLEAKKKYLEKLNFFANALLIQQEAIDELKKIQLNMHEIITALNTQGDICCISIAEDRKSICGHEKDEYGQGTTRILQDPAAQKYAETTLAPFLLLSKSKKETYQSSLAILKNKTGYSDDMIATAQYIKNLCDYRKIKKKIRNLKFYLDFTVLPNLISTLKEILELKPQLEIFIISSNNKLITLMSNSKISDAHQALIPYFIVILEKIKALNVMVAKFSEPIQLKSIQPIYNDVNGILEWWNPIEECSNKLYKKILNEQENVLKSIPSYCPIKPDVMRLVHRICNFSSNSKIKNEKLPTSLHKEIGKDEKSAVQESFLDKSMLIKSPHSSPKTKKKKSRHRGHRKTQNINQDQSLEKENPHEEIRIKFPLYADRIISRFNRAPNLRDLYHTFSPLADGFIIKYGVEKQRTSKKYPTQTDTKYSLEGKIELEDGTVLFGKFGVTLGVADNICYHRHFKNPKHKEEAKSRKENIVSSTPLSNDPTLVKARLEFTARNDEMYGQKRFAENDKLVIIPDDRNSATITLFKPEQYNL